LLTTFAEQELRNDDWFRSESWDFWLVKNGSDWFDWLWNDSVRVCRKKWFQQKGSLFPVGDLTSEILAVCSQFREGEFWIDWLGRISNLRRNWLSESIDNPNPISLSETSARIAFPESFTHRFARHHDCWLTMTTFSRAANFRSVGSFHQVGITGEWWRLHERIRSDMCVSKHDLVK
jgi:hypothetical protein